jgi:hypothetical protein
MKQIAPTARDFFSASFHLIRINCFPHFWPVGVPAAEKLGNTAEPWST